jgi:3-oxoacyl-[acyl-carrier protein] reductase
VADAKPVAVVTGAASGIGLASAQAFAAAGYRVALVDLEEATAAGHAEDLPDSIGIGCDIADPDAVAAAFGEVGATYGRIDALHANAGISTESAFETMPLEEIVRDIDVNLLGHLYCAKSALPLLQAAGGGAIVFTASVQAHLALPGFAPYAAAKAGLMAVARALAVELGPKGIRVNTVSPGMIDTPMHREGLPVNAAERQSYLEQAGSAIALGRIGDAAEVAAVVVFLCSHGAAYVTGEDVVVDGGYLRVKRF